MSYGMNGWYRSWSWSSSGPGREPGGSDGLDGPEGPDGPDGPEEKAPDAPVAPTAPDLPNLTPERFQDYLLDLVRLEGIHAFTGVMADVERTPVANWLRSLGFKMVYDDSEMEYHLYRLSDEAPMGLLPDYLLRFLALLEDDKFTEPQGVPAYQALSLLTFIMTTERYRNATRL